MPVTVRNTDILFNDGTTQATAAGALTTTAVLDAYAGAAYGGVGTYTVALSPSTVAGGASIAAGTTVAGSGLRQPLSLENNNTTGVGTLTTTGNSQTIGLSGTWRLMMLLRRLDGTAAAHLNGLWLRIS
jgi:hypothetical protein